MSAGIERCPHCPDQLIARSNGNGQCYLECRGNCGYVEPVKRKADPHPTEYRERRRSDGRTIKVPCKAIIPRKRVA